MAKIGVDLDGVIFNFTDAYSELLTERIGIAFPKASDTWPTTWYWERAAGVNEEDELAVWNTRIWHEGSMFWRLLHPLSGAAEAVVCLCHLAHLGHDVYFVSNRAGHRAKIQTEKALYDLGMDYPTVVLTANKAPIIRSLGIDIFLDDKPETVLDVAKTAEDESLSVRNNVFIQDRPYNRHVQQANITRVTSVAEMLKMKGLWL